MTLQLILSPFSLRFRAKRFVLGPAWGWIHAGDGPSVMDRLDTPLLLRECSSLDGRLHTHAQA